MPRCAVWGILNVTPDSFSDGGAHWDEAAARERVDGMLAHGADVIDIGGQSTRPSGAHYGIGAATVSVDEELRRVLPAVRYAAQRRGARVSIDTTRAEVARQAIAEGAQIVNDVSGGQSSELLQVVAESSAELVLMHNRQQGQVQGTNIEYPRGVVAHVPEELLQSVARAERAGVARDRMWLDPGFGFAKTWEQSAACFQVIGVLANAGFRVLAGPSRKAFLAEMSSQQGGSKPSAQHRLGGTIAACVLAYLEGAVAVRVHDVAEVRQALDVLGFVVGFDSSPEHVPW
jgi:dihydropteroate synthase